jgi:hypothetical protein
MTRSAYCALCAIFSYRHIKYVSLHCLIKQPTYHIQEICEAQKAADTHIDTHTHPDRMRNFGNSVGFQIFTVHKRAEYIDATSIFDMGYANIAVGLSQKRHSRSF